MFKNSDLELRGLDIDGERLTDLRFADDVALTTNNVDDMEQQLNILNDQSKKVGLKIHRGKTKSMTNFATTQKIEIEGIEIEILEQYKYCGNWWRRGSGDLRLHLGGGTTLQIINVLF